MTEPLKAAVTTVVVSWCSGQGLRLRLGRIRLQPALEPCWPETSANCSGQRAKAYIFKCNLAEMVMMQSTIVGVQTGARNNLFCQILTPQRSHFVVETLPCHPPFSFFLLFLMTGNGGPPVFLLLGCSQVALNLTEALPLPKLQSPLNWARVFPTWRPLTAPEPNRAPANLISDKQGPCDCHLQLGALVFSDCEWPNYPVL